MPPYSASSSSATKYHWKGAHEASQKYSFGWKDGRDAGQKYGFGALKFDKQRHHHREQQDWAGCRGCRNDHQRGSTDDCAVYPLLKAAQRRGGHRSGFRASRSVRRRRYSDGDAHDTRDHHNKKRASRSDDTHDYRSQHSDEDTSGNETNRSDDEGKSGSECRSPRSPRFPSDSSSSRFGDDNSDDGKDNDNDENGTDTSSVIHVRKNDNRRKKNDWKNDAARDSCGDDSGSGVHNSVGHVIARLPLPKRAHLIIAGGSSCASSSTSLSSSDAARPSRSSSSYRFVRYDSKKDDSRHHGHHQRHRKTDRGDDFTDDSASNASFCETSSASTNTDATSTTDSSCEENRRHNSRHGKPTKNSGNRKNSDDGYRNDSAGGCIKTVVVDAHEDGWTSSDADSAVNRDFDHDTESDVSFYSSADSTSVRSECFMETGSPHSLYSSVSASASSSSYSSCTPTSSEHASSSGSETPPFPPPLVTPHDPLAALTRSLKGCMLLCADRERRLTPWEWPVPRGVEWVIVTMAGGGGAGGCQTITGAVTTNGTGGQAGAAFINRPIHVCYGQTLRITIGNGGIPRCNALTGILEGAALASGATDSANPTIAPAPNGSRGFREANAKLSAVIPPGTRQVITDLSDGAATTLQCFDENCDPVGNPLIGQGGLSGDHLSDPDYADLLRFGRFGGFGGDPGTPGDSSSSSALAQAFSLADDAAIVYGASNIPGQGGSSAFAAGGIPMVTPQPSVLPFSSAFGTLPNASPAGTNGDMGSGGAGATTTFQAGFGGPGFAYLIW